MGHENEKCYASTHRMVNAQHTCGIPGKLQKKTLAIINLSIDPI